MANILIVENDKDMCSVISDILKEEGYLVDRAYNAKSVIRIIKKKNTT